MGKPKVTEIVLRITQTDDAFGGPPETWDWPAVLDMKSEDETVELISFSKLEWTLKKAEPTERGELDSI